MKKLAAINFLDSFIYSGFQIILPLLLLARGIDLVIIGIVFSMTPLVFLFARLVFASLADQVGVRKFFVLNGASAGIASIVFLVAASPFVFAFGKIFEGLKNSSFWAVNRTAVVQMSKQQAEKNAALLSGVRSFALAAGMLTSGMIIAFYSFETALLAMLAASIAVIPFAFALEENEARIKPTLSRTVKQLDLRKKPVRFWLVALAMAFIDIPVYTMLAFILPIFMRIQLNFGYELIGVLLAAYYAFQSLGTFAAVKTKMNAARIALLLLALFVPSAVLISFTSGLAFVLLLLLISFSCGLGLRLFESLIIQTTKESKTISVDVGLLHIPIRAGEFIVLMLAGFLVQSFGFASVFWLCAASIAAFALLSTRLLKITLPSKRF